MTMENRNSKDAVNENRRKLARQVRSWSIVDFLKQMEEARIYRAYIVFENGEFTLSHPKLLGPVQAFLELSQDFANHEGVFIGREDGIPTPFFAFVHDTRRGLAQGGLRFWRYETLADVLLDGLRLAQGMTRKNALAGLWWGGGKGIIPLPPNMKMPDQLPHGDERRKLFEAYGRFVASLGGIYYTAEDVGTKTADLDAVLTQNRFTTCISTQLGGSGNPSPFTAQGVFRGIQAARMFLTGSESLHGVRVAVQGAGNVGRPLIELLDDAGARVWIADVNEAAVRSIQKDRPRIQAVSSEDIFDLDVDILAPCARGGAINSRTIPRLKARLICGAANNILEETYDAERLRKRGIWFMPDYVVNRMGITNCADEWLGYLADDIRLAAERVYPDSLRVLRHARNLFVTPAQAANELADIAASELHPLLRHRGRRIIDHLIASDWCGNKTHRQKKNVQLGFDPAIEEPRLRLAWERQGRFSGEGTALAATPISAASIPNLSSFVAPLLLDVRARYLESVTGKQPHRVLGSGHGGLALQFAIERSLPYEREEVGRVEFVAMCHDHYNRNDASTREQLHQLGVGFDPQAWLDPMGESGKRVIERLFQMLNDADLIFRDNRWAYQCPRCQTVLGTADVNRDKLKVDHSYNISFNTKSGVSIDTHTYFPELVIGAVAVAVKKDGRYGRLSGEVVTHPLTAENLPVIAVENLSADAVFLVPSHHRSDEQIARKHGITKRQIVYDKKGMVSLADKAKLPLEDARQAVLEKLGAQARQISKPEEIDIHRCQRCETIVFHGYSEQLFVKMETGIALLQRAIESGAVRFSHPCWQERVIDFLRQMEPWCISSQHWWGNEVPGHSAEVLSAWFSLAASSLQGAGWPDNSNPAPIDELFVDPELLIRWVIPSQIISLMVTGRPLFQRVDVHGTLHVVERRLQKRDDVADDMHDEERFIFKAVGRRMRRSFGNAVEPSTLIRRFGADALRLGYLLCLDHGYHQFATLSEGRLRQARKSLRLFVSKLTGLFHIVEKESVDGEIRIADRWILASSAQTAASARKAYEDHRPIEAAKLLVNMIDDFARYVNIVAKRRLDGSDLGAVRATTVAVVTQMESVFNPICPFLFEKVGQLTREKFPQSGAVSEVQLWIAELVENISNQHDSSIVEIGTPETAVFDLLKAGQAELELLSKTRVSITAKPSAGKVAFVDRCVIVKPGALEIPDGTSTVAKWYRGLHEGVATQKAVKQQPKNSKS